MHVFTKACALGMSAAMSVSMAVAAPAPAKDVDARVRQAAESFMREQHIPGMAIAVTVDGKERFYNFGVASKETQREVTSDTLFELGSISKTFLATLAACAQVEGKLSLAERVEAYLPDYQGTPFGKVALFDLGTHTAGGFPLQVPDEVTDQGQLTAWLKAWKPRYAEGTKRTYANPSIGMLGAIAAQRLGMPYAEAAEKSMFPRLGLGSTYIRIPADRMAAYAQGYTRDGGPVRLKGGPLGDEAYGVKSTARDLVHYLEVQLGEAPVDPAMRRAIADTRIGYYRSGPMIQALAWEYYPWPVSEADLLKGNDSRMVLEDQPAAALVPPRAAPDAALINKTGATGGFGAYVAFVPAKRFGLVILANRNHPTEARVSFAYRLMEVMGMEASSK